ncbi:GLIPR1-like protein 1 [Littorina saxatilis]|uniref:SCP domain-containing protein n=1 Tax=Littorina saxatilis TaxID=31220 RepID=A0AAN9B792_9CAEN
MSQLTLCIAALVVASLVGVISAESLSSAFINKFNAVRRHEATTEHVSNMFKMAWDNTLASQAQHWANNCKFVHSHTGGVGETIYVTSSDTDTTNHYATKAIDAWMSEKKLNTNGHFSCCKTGCGHYCMTVRDVATHVGCGVKKCAHVGSYTTGTLVVCQFKTDGTGAGAAVYHKGGICSQCGANTHCESNLCVHGAAHPIG